MAVCRVEGGPSYHVHLRGESAQVTYHLDRTTIDCGKEEEEEGHVYSVQYHGVFRWCITLPEVTTFLSLSLSLSVCVCVCVCVRVCVCVCVCVVV